LPRLLQGWAAAAADARAAVTALAAARCAGDARALAAAGGEALFAGLLRDPDARVRLQAATFLRARTLPLWSGHDEAAVAGSSAPALKTEILGIVIGGKRCLLGAVQPLCMYAPAGGRVLRTCTAHASQGVELQ